jgi:two-component system, chemotaxis family, sensor kinase CheA
VSQKNIIEERLNDVSMLLLMCDGSDPTGVEALEALIKELVTATGSDAESKRIHDGFQSILEAKKEIDLNVFLEQVQQGISAAQAVLNQTTGISFPCENVGKPVSKEFGENFDQTFLIEFIEKHSLLLEECESQITQIQFSVDATEDEVEQFNRFIKKYLHNIKGDAGSIGLRGIERVTHEIEDVLQGIDPRNCLDGLLTYREWVGQCLSDITNGNPISVSSDEFLEEWHTLTASGISRVSKVKEEVAQEIKSTPQDMSQVGGQTVVVAAPTVSTPTQGEKHVVVEGAWYTITADPEIYSEFRAEAEDHLNNVEGILLEKSEGFSPDDVSTIFRGVHSLKGASSYFELEEINKTSHILENILDEVRSGKRPLDQILIQLTLKYIDLQKVLLVRSQKAVMGDAKMQWTALSHELMRELEAYRNGNAIPAPVAPVQIAPTPVTSEQSVVPVDKTHDQKISDANKEIFKEQITKVADRFEQKIQQVQEELKVFESPQPKVKEQKAPPEGAQNDKLAVKNFVKVDTARLDKLIDSIGEMVIYSSMLIRSCRENLGDNEHVMKTSHQVEKFSRSLQDIGMSMRLDPIKGLFQKMQRLVWDVSKKMGKEITFVMSGEETELDRTVIEKLADPLMHMIRNALDHGVETPDDREKNGKPRGGKVSLSAYHSSGSVVVEIQDDGRGLNPEKLLNKAIEKGVIQPGQNLTRQEIYALIFAPGFSTAAVVTDISGRGVGMDVVRNNIESMRGQIRIDSEVNVGTTFWIELPLTLAIMDGIETIVGSDRFVIPTTAVLEFIRPTKSMVSTAAGRGEVFQFRGKFLPLYRLSELFEITAKGIDPTEATIVVVENGGEEVALMIDDIVGSCQTVIKNLGPMFHEGRGFAGCAIMPNGDIGLILDIRSLVQHARMKYVPQQKIIRAGWEPDEAVVH